MSYKRVIPRDLFNEANLLKLYGQVALHLHDHPIEGVALIYSGDENDEDGSPFDIDQDIDGNLLIMNLDLYVRGVGYLLSRPINTREPWSLYAQDIYSPDSDPTSVFDHEGRFSPEMYALLTGIPQFE
jgi:hypothetical protein